MTLNPSDPRSTVSTMYCIYIDQGASGVNGVHSSASGIFLPLERKAEDIVWPGESPEEAVQGLQDRHPYYIGDTFIVGRVDGTGRANNMVRVRVNAHGQAVRA